MRSFACTLQVCKVCMNMDMITLVTDNVIFENSTAASQHSI